mmetsp:Transcript_101004/g.290616  ORF Transcript_101004/g.290616 Transcript_101004/m.290616 type:complete len:207 (-) Transcript_101004:772-1392(-)
MESVVRAVSTWFLPPSPTVCTHAGGGIWKPSELLYTASPLATSPSAGTSCTSSVRGVIPPSAPDTVVSPGDAASSFMSGLSTASSLSEASNWPAASPCGTGSGTANVRPSLPPKEGEDRAVGEPPEGAAVLTVSESGLTNVIESSWPQSTAGVARSHGCAMSSFEAGRAYGSFCKHRRMKSTASGDKIAGTTFSAKMSRSKTCFSS